MPTAITEIDFFKLRTDSEFSFSEKLREFSGNDLWKSNEALWNFIGAFANEPGSVFYERSVDMVKNIADVDFCDVKHLESLSYQLGINSGFGFVDSLPQEVYDLMNILSIKHAYLFENDRILTKSGVDAAYAEIADGVVKSYSEIYNELLNEDSFTQSFSVKLLPAVVKENGIITYNQKLKIGTLTDLNELKAEFPGMFGDDFGKVRLDLLPTGSSLNDEYLTKSADEQYDTANFRTFKITDGQIVYAIFTATSTANAKNGTWKLFTAADRPQISMHYENINTDAEAENFDFITATAPLVIKLPAKTGTDAELNFDYSNTTKPGTIVAIKVEFDEIPKFMSQTSFLNDFVQNIYEKLILKHLSCERQFGNESYIEYYKEKFVPLVGLQGFQQMMNDKNINHQFYRGLAFSNFCSNLTSLGSYTTDWFIDYTIPQDLLVNGETYNSDNDILVKSIIKDVAKVLTDFTLAIMVRRDLLKKLASQYAQIGSNESTEKVIINYIARNYSKRYNDWQLRSNVAVTNDAFLPSLEQLAKGFNVEVTEYYDNTEYLNISAESDCARIPTPIYNQMKVCSTVDLSGQLITGYYYTSAMTFVPTNMPIVSGGNERFWENDSYQSQFSDMADDIVEFYKNVKGSSLTSIVDVSNLITTIWDNHALSALPNKDMHRKYIGSEEGYFPAINTGNLDYPTIAPLTDLVGLSKLYGSLDRDYQSVLNDDRPVIVEGVDAILQPRLEFRPWEYERDAETIDGLVLNNVPPNSSPSEYSKYIIQVVNNVQKTNEYWETVWDEIDKVLEVGSIVTVEGVSSKFVPSSWVEIYTSSQTIWNNITGYGFFYGAFDDDDNPVSVRLYSESEKTIWLNDGYDINFGVSATSISSALMTDVQVTHTVDPEKTSFYTEEYTSTINDNLSLYVNTKDLSGSGITSGVAPNRFQAISDNIEAIKADYIGDNSVRDTLITLLNNVIITPTVNVVYDLNASATYKKDDNGEPVPGSIKTYGDVITEIDNYRLEYASLAGNQTISGVNPTVLEVASLIEATTAGKISATNWFDDDFVIDILHGTMMDTADWVGLYDAIEDAQSLMLYDRDSVFVSGTCACFDTFEAVAEQLKNTAISANNTAIAYDDMVIDLGWEKYLSELNQSELDATFGIDKYYYDPMLTSANLIPAATGSVVIGMSSYQIEVPYPVTITGNVPVEVPYSYEKEITEEVTVKESVSSEILVQETYFEPITSYITAFISSYIPGSVTTRDSIYGMFDNYGGIINSWRNVSVELRGYHSRYEASPNLDQHYVENKFIDYDGPWIGEAMYSLIRQLATDDYNDPLNTAKLDINALKAEFNTAVRVGEIEKLNCWWMAEYTEIMAVNLEQQIKFYLNDILACRTKSIYEFDADSHGNQYTLFKDRNDFEQHDSIGVLWMRHNGFPFSFPVLKPWYSGNFHPYSEPPTVQGEEGMVIDQLKIGYAIPTHRTIMNNCLAFGVNNTTLYVAGYDGVVAGQNHFNIRIYSNSYSVTNKKKYYGVNSVRAMAQFNPDPNPDAVEFPIETYKWNSFAGGYYDTDRIVFVFFRESGFAIRTYNLITARLNNADEMIPFTESNFAENHGPDLIDNSRNQLRLVEDNDYFYVGWSTTDRHLVVCKVDKNRFDMASYLSWLIPDSVTNHEVDKLIAGEFTVKVKFKDGSVFYGPMHNDTFSNEGNNDELLISDNVVASKYLVNDSVSLEQGGSRVKIPKVPIVDITQWRHWGYSLTTNTLFTINYDDVLRVSGIAEYELTEQGYHYNTKYDAKYYPGECMKQEMIAYKINSGIWNLDRTSAYVEGRSVLTGYEIGVQVDRLCPALQQVIPAYGPAYASAEIPLFDSPIDVQNMTMSSSVGNLDSYYGLPYNVILAERTDFKQNYKDRNITEIGGGPRCDQNYLVLKNFYNYSYNHEYSWNVEGSDEDSNLDNVATGWRKYVRCSISRYSDAMWLGYRFLRDPLSYSNFNKQQSVAVVLNDFEWVELVYGTLQLMNNAYSKSNIFSVKINDSTFNGSPVDAVYDEDGNAISKATQMEVKTAMRKQITEDVRGFIDRYAPAHTQLWKVEFDN